MGLPQTSLISKQTSLENGQTSLSPKWAVRRGGSRGDPNRYMLGSTRNKALSGFAPASLYVAPADLSVFAPLLKFGTLWETDEGVFRFAGSQYTEGGNAPQETTFASNDITLHELLLVYGGQSYACDFSGAASDVIGVGAAGKWAHIKLPFKLPANSVYGLVPIYSVPIGATVLGQYRIQRHRGEKVWQGASVADVKTQMAADAATAAAFASGYNLVTNQPAGQNLAYGPDLIAWKGWDGRACVLGIFDSLADRQELAASADERGNYGFAPRLMDRASDGRLGFFNIGCPGAKAVNILATNALKIVTGLDELAAMNGGKQGFTHIWQQSGRNDNNATAATWLTPIRNLNTRVRNKWPGIPIIGTTITATTTSSTRWQTSAGQTLAALWSTTLATVNSAILAGNSATTDAVIDLFAYRMAGDGKFRPGVDRPMGTVPSQAGTDGTATFTVFTTDFLPQLGQQYTIDISGGAGTSYTGGTIVDIQGSGPYTVTRSESAGVVIPAGSLVYEQPSPDGIHFNLGQNTDSVAAIPASEKAKFSS